jgi:hypothetical protein
VDIIDIGGAATAAAAAAARIAPMAASLGAPINKLTFAQKYRHPPPIVNLSRISPVCVNFNHQLSSPSTFVLFW